MPQGIVVEHKSGAVKLRVVFDAAVTEYKFYSAEDGSGSSLMILRQTVAAPVELPPGFAEFDFTDADLGIKNPGRGWHIRITEKGASGVHTAVLSEPLTLITESTVGQKKIRQTTTAAVMDGTAGKGLFDFKQDRRIFIERVNAKFSVNSAYTLSVVDSDGKESTIKADTVVGPSFFLSDRFPIDPGDKIKLVTTVAGNQEAEVVRE